MDENLTAAIQALAEKVDELSERLDQLDSALYDGIIGPANEQIAENEYNAALSDFRCKYAEKLGKYDDRVKALNGDDYDLVKETFDHLNETEEMPDEYVEKVAANIEKQLSAIAEVFGKDKAEEVVEEAKSEAVENATDSEDESKTEVTIKSEGKPTLEDLKEMADKMPSMLRF